MDKNIKIVDKYNVCLSWCKSNKCTENMKSKNGRKDIRIGQDRYGAVEI